VFHRGAVPEMIELKRSDVGVYQMPYPEQRAWGGVLKRRMLRACGLRDSALYRFHGAKGAARWLLRSADAAAQRCMECSIASGR
jgi:hypothetical protein